jgi:hypothetical protein
VSLFPIGSSSDCAYVNRLGGVVRSVLLDAKFAMIVVPDGQLDIPRAIQRGEQQGLYVS